jgi:hypothetical protein
MFQIAARAHRPRGRASGSPRKQHSDWRHSACRVDRQALAAPRPILSSACHARDRGHERTGWSGGCYTVTTPRNRHPERLYAIANRGAPEVRSGRQQDLERAGGLPLRCRARPRSLARDGEMPVAGEEQVPRHVIHIVPSDRPARELDGREAIVQVVAVGGADRVTRCGVP